MMWVGSDLETAKQTLVLSLTSILVFLCITAAAQTQGTPVANVKPAPQDPIALLEKSEKSFFDVRAEASAIWQKDKALRPRLVSLVSREGLSPNVFIGVGSVLAEKGTEAGANSTLQLYLDAIISGRLQKDSDADKVTEYVIAQFHHAGTVLQELKKRLDGSKPDQLNGIVALYLSLVRLSKPVGVNGRSSDRPHTRYAAFDDLVGVLSSQSQLPPASLKLVVDALGTLSSGQVRMAHSTDWVRWWQTLRSREGVGSEKALSIDTLLTALLEEERERSDALRRKLIDESLVVIGHMKAMHIPPLDHLSSRDEKIRATAVLAVKSVLKDATPEWRRKTLKRLLGLMASSGASSNQRSEWVGIAGVLGTVLEPKDQKSLSRKLLGFPVNGEPELAAGILESVISMGVIQDMAPVKALYEMARMEKSETWLRARQLSVKAAQLHPSGLPLAIRALDDPAAVVRGDAALTIEALQDVPVPEGQASLTATLAQHALVEKDAGALGRMLESIDVLVGGKPSRLTADALSAVLQLTTHTDQTPRRASLKILHNVVKSGSLKPAQLSSLSAGLGQSLFAAAGETEWAQIVDVLLACPVGDSSEMLVNWFAGQAATPGPTWRKLAAHFRKAWDKNPGRLWDTAVSLAALEREGAHIDALPFGKQAMELIAASANHPMARRLPEFGASVARWQVATRDVKRCTEALAYLDNRVKAEPKNGRILLLRADALEVLGRNLDAANDIEVALAGGSPGLGDLPREPLWGRLARHRFNEANWGACRVAVEELVRLKSQRPGDLLMAAWADALEVGADRRRVMTRAAPLIQAHMQDAAALVQAAACLMSADATLRGEAEGHLKSVAEVKNPLLLLLKAEREHAVRLDALLAVSPQPDFAAVTKLMSQNPHQSNLTLVAQLRADGSAKLLEVLKQANPKDAVLQPMAWPDPEKGDASVVRHELLEWAKRLAPPKKLVAACLKGALPHI